MKPLNRIIAAIMCILLLCLSLAACSSGKNSDESTVEPDAAPETTTIRLAFYPHGHVLNVIAEDQGYLEEEGIKVEYVNVGVGADAPIECGIALAAYDALGAYADKVVGIERADEGGGLAEPPCERLLHLQTESAGLIAYLPCHQGGIVGVGQSGVAVGARDDEANMVEKELLRPAVGGEAALILTVCLPRHLAAQRGAGLAGLLEIVGIAATPLP